MKRVIFFLVAFFASNITHSQVNENYQQVYDYLYRMAQKGVIELDDMVLPFDRDQLKLHLLNIQKSNSNLTKIETNELEFYLKEFAHDTIFSSRSRTSLLRKDSVGRFRMFQTNGQSANLFIDPVIGSTFAKYPSANNSSLFSGVRVWGKIGKNIGFNVMVRDVTEFGDSIDHKKEFSPVTGVVNTSREATQLNYSQVNFNLGYKWKNGSIAIGKDYVNWGYGIVGKIVVSSKAPSFPYVRLDYHPFKWLHFNYFNAWLNSNLVDSARSYGTGTGVGGSYREVFREKYMASHSVNIHAIKGLDIAIGESMIYSDKLDIGYLIPINIFKFYDQYSSNYRLSGGSNSQFFGQISSRNHIKNTHLYLVYFIDEIRTLKIFDKVERRNQLGYTIGFSSTDFLTQYLSIGSEYTRINPFVYTNLVPAQSYESSEYPIGDWIGNNGDRWYSFIKYTPLAKMKISVWYQHLRKGGKGNLIQQYYQQPQPEFLFDLQFKESTLGLNLSYEWLNRLNFFMNAKYRKIRYGSTGLSTSNSKEVSLGFSYGI